MRAWRSTSAASASRRQVADDALIDVDVRNTQDEDERSHMQISKDAAEAIRLIQLIRRHPAPQSEKAEEKVLGRLSVADYLAAISELDGHRD